MTQPSLLDLSVPRRHRPVRATSREQATVLRDSGQLSAREQCVALGLAYHWNVEQANPTGAELSDWIRAQFAACATIPDHYYTLCQMDRVTARYWCRRALSDLAKRGAVEMVTDDAGRIVRVMCGATGTKAGTWRLRQR